MRTIGTGLLLCLVAGAGAAEERLPAEELWPLADLGLAFTVRADEVRFETVPELRVSFRLGRGAQPLNATWRLSLPEQPEPGVTYRNIQYQRLIAVRLSPEEWDLIIADELAHEARP